MTGPDAPAVVVVGDAGLDVVARHDGPIVHGGDARAEVRLTGGGAGANTALWLRACGARPTLVARVGDDTGGRLVRAELEAAGVRCAFAVDPDAATCCVVVLVDGEGQRSMLPDRGANARFAPADVAPAALAGAAHLHLSGYVLLDPTSRPAGLAALAAARAAGLSTSVDPQAAALLTDPDAFLADVRGVDLLLPNIAELRALTGRSDPAAAGDLLGTVGAVAVTAGPAGASWVDAAGVVSVPAPPATCVDSTGAGDAFDAGVLTAWLRGAGPEAAVRAGVRAGSDAVRQVGAQPVRSPGG
ncbi:Sugar or nucleoside kinase, ribokinase family [Amycolatopsis arida]|uniref:Sugar or nucleoside kinase, ribokinase family n=1 Tax=Amycolatopsis arida TaxID=587909 RepID=A0A1I5ZXQ2_9PSEU|nr:carbohydrate kinase family protein [Amycolatopsis arida]TDX89447.1 sugar/nucleoside kinase (ribokinase family) [Amycolatopsis arida]SFQ61259.1 Sugar or nucleoside kinase, ribokinase family [Amycolatopsis arida]